jgi:hypothetical protein
LKIVKNQIMKIAVFKLLRNHLLRVMTKDM